MKVVLFCGGLGMRLREYTEAVPKPMVNIGSRPILWHLMKYYAHYGHREFILCLGYRGDIIKRYFLDHDERTSTDHVAADGNVGQLTSLDLEDWSIRFVDTGLHANVGQRLLSVKEHVAGDPVFLANYSDGLSDLPLPAYLEDFRRRDRIAGLVCVRPHYSGHVLTVGPGASVSDVQPLARAGLWMNGGFFAFRREIFEYIKDGEDLVEEPFRRLVAEQQLSAYRHAGFWACMDTFKDKELLEQLSTHGSPPWDVWTRAQRPRTSRPLLVAMPGGASAPRPKRVRRGDADRAR